MRGVNPLQEFFFFFVNIHFISSITYNIDYVTLIPNRIKYDAFLKKIMNLNSSQSFHFAK